MENLPQIDASTINKPYKDYKTPLYWASKHGNIELVKIILFSLRYCNDNNFGNNDNNFDNNDNNFGNNDNNLDNKRDNFGNNIWDQNSLHIAVRKGHYDIVRLLLKNGFNVDQKDSDGLTPLHISCCRSDALMAKLLLEYGAQIDSTDNDLNTPLMYTKDYCIEIAKLLVENGANISHVNVKGESVIQNAITRFAIELTEYLLTQTHQNVNLNLKFKDGNTLLHTASERDIKISKMLIKNGAEINITNDQNRTPLLFAMRTNNYTLVEFFLKNGANPNVADIEGITPLSIAIQYGEEQMVKLLLQYKVDPNTKYRNENSTPLFAAVHDGKYLIAKLLLEHGANLHDSRNAHLLHIASKGKNIELVKLLMQYDVDPFLKNGENFTARKLVYGGYYWGEKNEIYYLLKKYEKKYVVMQTLICLHNECEDSYLYKYRIGSDVFGAIMGYFKQIQD